VGAGILEFTGNGYTGFTNVWDPLSGTPHALSLAMGNKKHAF